MPNIVVIEGLQAHAGLPQRYAPSVESATPHWYAAYTRARHEKRVAEHLLHRDISFFLPLYSALHRWKDRRVRVELPLFPSYVFVHIPLRNRLHVLEIPGVVSLVTFGAHPAPLPDNEIEPLRAGLVHPIHAQPCPYLKVGRRVRIKHGPLAGAEGILLRKRSNLRVVLSIDLIRRSVSVEVDSADIEPIF